MPGCIYTHIHLYNGRIDLSIYIKVLVVLRDVRNINLPQSFDENSSVVEII